MTNESKSTASIKNNSRSSLKRIILSFCAASSLFLWVPLYIVHLSVNDINFLVFDFFLCSLTLTFLATAIFFITASFLALIRLNWIGSALLYFILFWTCIAGYILPLTEKAGMVSPDSLPTNTLNLYIVACASLLLTMLTFTKLKSATQVFLLILTVTTVGAAMPSLYKASASVQRLTGLSSSDNVLVLSFDGLAGNVAKQVLEEDSTLKQKLKDFILYDNAIAPAPATQSSLRAEIYGNMSFRELLDSRGDFIESASNRPNSIAREQDSSADVVTYGGYSSFNKKSADHIVPLTLDTSSITERSSTALSFYPYIAARVGTALAATIFDEQLHLLNAQYPLGAKAQRTLEHQGQNWDALATLHSDDLAIFTEKLHLSGPQRSVRFLHFLHTHFPVDFDENCIYRSRDKAWHENNQNYQGVLNETHCALKQTAALIEKLKALDIYDKTTFIVKSDHGAPVTYMENAPDDYMINSHPMFGYNRYRPLLMIKARAHESESLTYNSMIVSLSDLARTLCLQAPEKQACENFGGIDLLASNAEDPNQIIYVDVVKDENSTYLFDTQITVTIPRKRNFKEALESTGKVKLTNQMELFNQRKDDLARVNAALEEYHRVNGKYPVSQSFDGLHSTFGADTEDWIAGLAPTYISSLPRDPAHSDKNIPQYIYRSDGQNYKLLAHGNTASCTYAARLNPELLDPMRNCWGFGYWSEGARAW